ncbi:phosphatidylinositol-specific phospholipase C1-like protein [Stenotrophomonas sp. 24(2023)]|uniref:phosphatidylinositol-specific phospholipase C1-like protein n=1 Tax=Stenotrophomonas sp. 24(2023) TaxID=3068324 RepID=UPI0027DF285B|nr:phosphatidylinositol-specific phospholipase C1-like protein [Stenotrophomonas sp. 24(2023)]WMJ69250.1 phosphatidylinositol-specific phospholipase C1-like protein [Stenotrophomonas sp. 24(2023)]
MNDLIAVGTHNSYKQAIAPEELAALIAADPGAIGLDYAHPSLARQLDAGARQLEIDVHNDPAGGRYAAPLTALRTGHATDAAFRAAMALPGFKTLHMPDVDFRSSCLRFTTCLQQINAWSLAHPDHVPILILLNAKTGPASLPGGVTPLDFDATAWDALDAEIRAVFSDARLITPDQVRGRHATLRAAVLAGGWPRLAQARGKVFFALDEDGAKVAAYRAGHPVLQGRAMFVNAPEGSPAAAYLTLNDPVTQQARIQAAVRRGFIVRTRADAETLEARHNDRRRLAAALASGAQYLSTDYLWADPRFPRYQVRLPDGAAAICNTVRRSQCGTAPLDAVARDGTDGGR